jgi:hypothetical protein
MYVLVASHSVKSRLQEWMETEKLNYSTLAEAAKVDVGVIRRLAKNQFDRVDCANWLAICRYFKKPLGELFYDSEGEGAAK